MKIMDRPSRLLSNRPRATNELDSRLLDPVEIRLIADGHLARLNDFAASPRIHAVDQKGDTPLHLAARTGSLALCDLFIRADADPGALNHERQTPADVAFAEGHRFVGELLSSLIANSLEPESFDTLDEGSEFAAATSRIEAVPKPSMAMNQQVEPDGTSDELDDLLSFVAEETPEDFFGQSAGEKASGTFVAHVNSALSVADDEARDWELYLSPVQIAGEGIGSGATTTFDQSTEHDFLKVRNRGPRSVKRAVVQTGTRLSIDPEICMTWVEETLPKGWFSVDDMDALAALCEGNGDLQELRVSLQRNLEAAGLEFVDQASGHEFGLWDARSGISTCDLAEAIEAALTRSTRLPGTQRFIMDKSDELQLLEPMVRAKQELQVSILACEAAVETILNVLDSIRDGFRGPGTVSLRSIFPGRPDHAETAEVFAAADTLKSWHVNGRVMDGKRRREALAALEALDLSMAFHKEIVRSLEREQASLENASRLDTLISVFEASTERLILEHLPYARRFAARNVEEGEDPEDVFQVAFLGLQNSARRFDPERGYRFLIYATYWMRQAITRWRADEGTAIRIPAHRHENLAKLDRAIEMPDVRADVTGSDDELAVELGWTREAVRLLREIPRQGEYPEALDDWDALLPEPQIQDPFDQAETERIVAASLAELEERQAEIIRMRFGIGRDAEMTLEEIGQVYGVTRERIRQIEAKGLNYLSHPGRKRRLQTLLGM
ncbi:sigma-70 family RNA polymerase sigma factor [Ensifer sp. SSB1]|uniref:sigma-70 family RNA polymerase sigma factor n=1 Tax=Ensifer sp. SSB1 TaxID=2795385 RepID=UPI001A619131|nr:sigma-70 family RNA polymerase sigma factor [Ensifer sp. SSB1]MBK5568021.1 sigma-70 family RNA polymerase sigma factor [Ensifer sp. SSB1]